MIFLQQNPFIITMGIEVMGNFWFAGCQNGSCRPRKYTSYLRYITDSSTTRLWASKKQKINPKTQLWDFMIFFQFFLDAENPYWRACAAIGESVEAVMLYSRICFTLTFSEKSGYALLWLLYSRNLLYSDCFTLGICFTLGFWMRRLCFTLTALL